MGTYKYYLRRTGVRPAALEQAFDTARQAFQAIGQAVYDNGLGTKKESQRFAATVTTDGKPAEFGPYIFTLVKALPCHYLTPDGGVCSKQAIDQAGHCLGHANCSDG
jgi:hypothetical protein